MEKIELYHINVSPDFKKMWEVGNTINVDSEFKSIMYDRYYNFSDAVKINEESRNYYFKLALLINDLSTKNTVTKKELENIKKTLNEVFPITYNASLFKRETALEDCRIKINKDLPSRLHSIYLADEYSVKYWYQELGFKGELYKVSVAGNVFKTNEQLLPDEALSYGAMLEEASKYWQPRIKSDIIYANEYLAQGEIKVLKRIY